LLEHQKSFSKLLILMHDHPDPDAIASAWGLSHLAEKLCGIRSKIVYRGVIGRMENRTMIQALHIPIYPARPKELAQAEDVVLVDTQTPFQNNCFSPRRKASMIIDHHPLHKKTKADYLLIDEEVGATTTLLAEALLDSGIAIPSRLATALVYGITSETQNLWRETSPRDIAAYRALFPKASLNTLSKIQNPSRPSSFFKTLRKAIHHAFVVKNVIGVHLGAVANQDVVAHMADFLLTHEKMKWSIVTGRYENRLCISLRTHNRRAQAGRLLWRLLGAGTSAGGHAMIAGGSIPIEKKDDEVAWDSAERKIMIDFLKSQGFKEPLTFDYPYRNP